MGNILGKCAFYQYEIIVNTDKSTKEHSIGEKCVS